MRRLLLLPLLLLVLAGGLWLGGHPGALPGPGFKGQLIYLVVLLFAHNPFSGVFSYAPGLIYPWYAEAPRVFGLSPVQDQNLAGVLMGVVYLTALLIAAAVVFARWFGGRRAEALVPPAAQGAPETAAAKR